jgi:hypothetical protein
MANKPEPPKPISRNLATKAARPDEVEAQDEAAAIQREGIRAGHEADGDTAMTRREGEISDLKRNGRITWCFRPKRCGAS